jgi:hypothetical protein
MSKTDAGIIVHNAFPGHKIGQSKFIVASYLLVPTQFKATLLAVAMAVWANAISA